MIVCPAVVVTENAGAGSPTFMAACEKEAAATNKATRNSEIIFLLIFIKTPIYTYSIGLFSIKKNKKHNGMFRFFLI